MGWWNKMVRMRQLGLDFEAPVYEKGYPSFEAVNRDTSMEQQIDGMWCEELSEPLTDWDYESEQP